MGKTFEPTILAIDTSCDETSVAVVRGLKVLSNIMPTQIAFHKKYGGVVPSIARYEHERRIDDVVTEALQRAQLSMKEIEFVAVTQGPGLAIALEVGIRKAKELAEQYHKPLITVNHMIGHLFSALAAKSNVQLDSQLKLRQVQFPALGFLISGGHTELIYLKNFSELTKIGETLDDSCGEAYDKCGRMLGFGYPAGPAISKFANEHRKNMEIMIKNTSNGKHIFATNNISQATYSLPISMANSADFNFSYSGLKTAFHNLLTKISNTPSDTTTFKLHKNQLHDVIVTFEAAALTQLVLKLTRAIDKYQPRELFLGGGVTNSTRLRSMFRALSKQNNLSIHFPYTKKLTTDNAAMIGVAAYIKIFELGGTSEVQNLLHKKAPYLRKQGFFQNNFQLIDRQPSLSI